MSDILKLGVLASGRGSNLQSILDAIDAGDLEARVNVVISNTPRCLALERASGRGIRTECISRKAAGGRQSQLLKMTETLQETGVDMVVLAGFNLITPPEMAAAFPDRILNIHPSLLPAFAGGMAPSPQQDAIDWGAKVSGCTIHVVTNELDAGPIVAQAAVPVRDTDDAETLSDRILVEEHRLYPQVLQWFAEGRVRVAGRRVFVAETPDSTEAGECPH